MKGKSIRVDVPATYHHERGLVLTPEEHANLVAAFVEAFEEVDFQGKTALQHPKIKVEDVTITVSVPAQDGTPNHYDFWGALPSLKVRIEGDQGGIQ